MELNEMLKAFKENTDKQQEEFMARILDSVEHLNEKSSRKDYEPTIKEKEMFSRIVNIIDNMKTWF